MGPVMNKTIPINDGQLPQIVESGQTGQLSRHSNPEALVERLVDLTVSDIREIERTLYNLGPGSRCVERLRITIVEED